MRILPPRSRSTVIFVVILFVLSACQQIAPGDKNSSADKNPTAAAAASPLVVDEIRVGAPIEGASAMKPQTSKDPISVTVKISGASSGTSLEVKVFDLKNGQVVANETRQLKYRNLRPLI